MEIKKISFSEFVTMFKQSIAVGKQHYFVIVVTAVISTVINLVLNASVFGSILSMPLAILFIAGTAYMSQVMIQLNAAPTVGQFFGAFYKAPLFKRLVSSLVISTVVNWTLLLVAAMFSSYVAQMFQGLGANLDALPRYTVYLGLLTLGSTLIVYIVNLFIFFLPLLGMFQGRPWKESLMLSIRGVAKSFPVMAIFIIPQILPVLAGSVIIMFATEIGKHEGAFSSLVGPVFRYGWVMATVLLNPFVFTLTYLAYKKIFVPAQPDAVIDEMK